MLILSTKKEPCAPHLGERRQLFKIPWCGHTSFQEVSPSYIELPDTCYVLLSSHFSRGSSLPLGLKFPSVNLHLPLFFYYTYHISTVIANINQEESFITGWSQLTACDDKHWYLLCRFPSLQVLPMYPLVPLTPHL